MLQIAPRIRLSCAILIVAGALSARSLSASLTIYALVLIAVGVSGVARQHTRFVALVTLPLLIALLAVWGWLLPNKHPPSYPNGFAFALATWLRIVATGAALQALMIPLIGHPTELHRFLKETRMPASIIHIMMTAVIFMPEVGRRLARLTEARAAQGYPNGPIARLTTIPKLLMPLVSSLLDTACRRAEFWTHRGVLVPRLTAPRPTSPMLFQVSAIFLGLGALYAALSL